MAGWVDAVVGGGLIVLPTLLLVTPGLAPQTALGAAMALTNIAGAVVGFTDGARPLGGVRAHGAAGGRDRDGDSAGLATVHLMRERGRCPGIGDGD